jgi:hypothetical protein
MDVQLATSIARARDAVAALEALQAAGCALTDGLMACTATIPAIHSAGVPHRELLGQLRDLSDMHLVFEEGSVSFELIGTPGAALSFLTPPTQEASAVFDGEELRVAERAWQGDMDAALSLTGTWHGNVSVQLQRPFAGQMPQLAWRAVRTLPALIGQLDDYPWWRTSELIRDAGLPVMVVIVAQEGIAFHSPSFGVASLDVLQDAPIPKGMAARRAMIQSCSAVRMPSDVALPEELRAQTDDAANEDLEQALLPKAEACAWAWLSSAMDAPQGGAVARLEFFGYRRKSFDVPANGYVAQAGQRAFSAYRWATVEESPDRVLAIRQVVSLQDGDALPDCPDDVVTAAEPLYRALRAGEVAAVLETQRQARSIAIDTARQSADAAQAAAKSATDRTIASLAAVAGIAVANATRVLSPADSRAIAVGIAGLFAFLAVWAIFIEGPPMRSPITSFAEDLPRIGSLLSEAERTAILDMSVITKAKRSILRIRVITPIVYALGAMLTLGIAHARFGLKFL